jgi:prophage DNA circulation protein
LLGKARSLTRLGAQIQALQTQVSQLQQQVTSANQNVSLLTNQVLQLQKTMTVQTNTVTNRIADLEQRFKTHTHDYTYEHLNYGTVDAGGAIASRINGDQMDAAKTSPPN